MTDKLNKHLIAGIAAIIALITYFITVAPTVSFWDCGEFIASAYTLGIPHPPGRPFFIIFVRAVMILLQGVEEVAKRANYISAFASAATVYLTALLIWELLSKLTKNTSKIIFSAAALSGALLLIFSDTFWFNAVEAEVYNLVMFVMLLICYTALQYLYCDDEGLRNRYLVLICYTAFLGIGFHLFAMLVIPATFVLVLLAGGQPLKDIINRWPLWVSGTVLCSVVYAISNFLTYALILLAILFIAWLVAKKSIFHKDISLSLALTIVALIGFSTHLYIPIRSSLNPIIDENDPEISIRNEKGELQLANLLPFEGNGNWLNVRDKNDELQLGNFLPFKENGSWRAFYDYLERKQYGSESMISRSFYRRSQFKNQLFVFPHMGYGGYQIAQYTPFKPGEVSYYRYGVYTADEESNSPVTRGSIKFPTLIMSIGGNVPFQAAIFLLFNGLLLWIVYIAFKSNKTVGIYLLLLYGFCSFGLLWYLNFADGTKTERRENEMWVKEMEYYTQLASGGVVRAPTVPNPNELLATYRKIYADHANGEKNSQARQNSAWQNWEKIQAIFASAGQQIPSFPDPVHLEVRNRDYFYTPGFVFMSLLYGLGIGFLLLGIKQRKQELLLPSCVAIVVLCGAIPLFANYKEHNRGNLWVPWDYAYNLLMSCEPNAILFTNGDNDTFPLWFAQEVAGIRKDVRVVNLSLGNTDWYIKQILDNEPILKLSYDKAGIDREMVLSENNYSMPSQRIEYWVNRANKYIPPLTARIGTLNAGLDSASAEDSAKINRELDLRKRQLQIYTALKDWGEPRKNSTMQTQYKLVVDLAMNNPDNPIHVSTTVGLSNAVGLDKYMVQKGMIWDLIKGKLTPNKDSMDIERTAHLVENVFKYRGLGDSTTFVNSETEQLLFNYNSIYIRLALAMRDSATGWHFKKGLNFLEMGIKQFPNEWRNYAVASDLSLASGNLAGAIEYLEKGLNIVPAGPGNGQLQEQLKILKAKE
jgi:hypothetical protein